MGGLERLAQVVARHVRVDLRGADPAVAEQLLDGAQVAAALDEMRRERVPEGVRARPSPAGPVASAWRRTRSNTPWRVIRRPRVVQHQRVALRRAAEERPPARQVAADGVARAAAARHDALAAALAEAADEAGVAVDVPRTQADELGHAQAGAVQQLERGPVAEPERRPVRVLDEPDRLLRRQRPRHLAPGPRQRHVADADRPGALAGAVAQEGARGGQPPADGGGRETLIA